MAESLLFTKRDLTPDLTQCGICLMVIEEPKALPCLHSYCLKCLIQYAKDKREKIKCPLCRQVFPIPPEGIQGFITNFVINTLKDRQQLTESLRSKDTKFPCLCCGSTDKTAHAFCTDCGGFICTACDQQHDVILSLKSHKTITFDDLQTGKVDVKSVMKKEHCKEHRGQVLRFYCKTCDLPICVECTVVNHQGHILVNLKTATDEQRSQIKQLMTDCGKVRDEVKKNLESVKLVWETLQKNIIKAKVDLHDEAEAIRKKVLAELQHQETELEAKRTQAGTENMKKIDLQKDNLELQQTRLQTALQMAKEVTEVGSEYDLALVFSSLNSSLSQLRDLKPEDVDEGLGELVFTSRVLADGKEITSCQQCEKV